MGLFLWFFWDSQKEIFTIPGLNFPIVWYSVLFAIGFIGGYYIFRYLLRRYFSCWPHFLQDEVIDPEKIKTSLSEDPQNEAQKKLGALYQTNKKGGKTEIIDFFNYLIDHPQVMKEVFDGTWKKKKRNPLQSQIRAFLEKVFRKKVRSLSEKAAALADKLFVYMIIATVLGARLGHIFFYEKWEVYLQNPLRIFKTWEGGLASHGAAVAILIALGLYCFSIRNVIPKLTWVKVLDLIAAPVAFCGALIRVGNFFNQEVLGTKSNLPWAVVFGNAADGSFPTPRHPVQLYEAIFYFGVFIFLLLLQKRRYFLERKGKTIGLFFILIFGFRFLIEFIKEKQSIYIETNDVLLMGHYLSIPFIILGVWFYFRDRFLREVK